MSDNQRYVSSEEREAAKASDIEQRIGHEGNLRGSGPGAELPAAPASDKIGSSGHIPRLEEIEPHALDNHTASPGADADRRAVERD